MMGRRKSDSPFSLFAFQDIITSVTGILIMIMLILCLTLFKSEDSESNHEAIDVSDAQKKLKIKQEELEKIREELTSVNQINQLATTLSPEQIKERLRDANRRSADAGKLISKLRADAEQQSQDLAQAQDAFAKNETLRKKIEELENASQKATSDLDALKKSNRVAYSFTDADNVSAWIIDLNGTKTRAAIANQKMKAKIFDDQYTSTRIQKIINWANSLDASSNYLVFMIRSENVKAYAEIRAALEKKGFKFGLNVVGSDVEIVDPETGAGL